MANEPNIPITEGDMPKGHEEFEAKNPVENKPNGEAGEDIKSEQGAKNGEGSSQVSDEQYKKLTEAWKEDREYFQDEIKRLRGEAKSPKLTSQEEEALEGLDENERVEKLIEFRQKRKEAAEKAELQAVKSEIRFYERTDKEFADNKQAILKVARDYDCKNLKQGILIWRGLQDRKTQTETQLNDQRKKEADGRGGGNAGGRTAGKPYDPKEDKNKSFGDFYREGGIS
jgi:hypothetical protein